MGVVIGIENAPSALDLIPLSFAQQRLWFIEQLGQKGPGYRISLGYRIIGDLDIQGLRRALDTIISRHESLRILFPSHNGVPRQDILKSCPIDIPLRDLSWMPAESRESETRREIDEEVRKRFDLAQGPLLRARVWKIRATEHMFVLVLHHIIADGWSLGVLSRELSEIYRSIVTGYRAELPDLPIQYSEYARRQRDILQGQVLNRQLSYWKERLSNAPTELQIPSDRPRPDEPTFRHEQEHFSIHPSLAEAVRLVSRRCQATPFMTFLAVFKVLLYRYTGQEDLLIGIPIAGRTQLETENLIGFFVNTLVLRSKIDSAQTFRQILRQIRSIALEAYSNQDLPFARLVEEINPKRDPRRCPLIQVIFAFDNSNIPLRLHGLEVEPLNTPQEDTEFDLVLSLTETDGVISGCVSYSTDLFDRATIGRLINHYESLLRGVAENPDCTVDRLPLITEVEFERLVREWNNTRSDYPRDASIPELFEEQVRHSPDAAAVACGGTVLTYEALNFKANQLANRLRAWGVESGNPVGILLNRSPEMVIAMLATLKAGGAYLPLDPIYPTERLSFMIRDSQAALIITDRSLRDRIEFCKGHTSIIDIQEQDFGLQSGSDLQAHVTAESLAYVMYTSGSTGTPKGVPVLQRGVVRLVVNTNYICIQPDDIVAQISNCSFDPATLEFWGALLNGACLRIIPSDISLSPRELALEINRGSISIVVVTTALFNLIAQDTPDAFARVRYVIFGGESAQPRWVSEIMAAGPPAHLVHVYGPTEATVVATWHEIVGPVADKRKIPIGRPISNTAVYILHPNLQPAPIGVPGEIYLGGDGLAQGYLSRPELTAEKFVPNPFEESGSSLYRTGDIGRFLCDGSIEFLGRKDNQVKIRGFRVEIEDIETTLAQHPDLEGVVVLPIPGPEGNTQLVAYVVPKYHPGPAQHELKAFLRAKVPEFMIPYAFASLNSFPLNPNGKIDRAALATSPLVLPPNARTAPIKPADKIEIQLMDIWKSVLGVSDVSRFDDFFDIGGHSLLAVRLLSHINREFGKRFALADVFRCRTIQKMADALREQFDDSPSDVLVPLQSSGSRPPFFWVHGDFSNPLLPRYLGRSQPLFGLVHQSSSGRPAQYTEVKTIAAYYYDLLRKVQPNGPYFLGGFSFGGLVAYEMAQQARKQNQEIGLVVLLDPTIPELTNGNPESSRLMKGRHVGWFLRHWKTIRELNAAGLLHYLYRSVTWRLASYKSRLRRLKKKALIKICFALRRPLSAEMQSFYLVGLYRKAADRYDIVPFEGPVLLIMGNYSQVRHFPERWQTLVPVGLEVFHLSADHMDLVKEPHLAEVGKCIEKHLREAQARCASKNPDP